MAKKGHKKPESPKKQLQVPQAVINTAVPTLVGFALGATLFQNIPLAALIGVVFGLVGFFLIGKRVEKVQKELPQKTPNDILLHALAHTVFLEVETYDERRKEAVSIDGERWSQIMTFRTESGESDVFMVRGSLVTGESKLEYVDGISQHFPAHWETEAPEGWDDQPVEATFEAEEPVIPVTDDSVEVDSGNIVESDLDVKDIEDGEPLVASISDDELLVREDVAIYDEGPSFDEYYDSEEYNTEEVFTRPADESNEVVSHAVAYVPREDALEPEDLIDDTLSDVESGPIAGAADDVDYQYNLSVVEPETPGEDPLWADEVIEESVNSAHNVAKSNESDLWDDPEVWGEEKEPTKVG